MVSRIVELSVVTTDRPDGRTWRRCSSVRVRGCSELAVKPHCLRITRRQRFSKRRFQASNELVTGKYALRNSNTSSLLSGSTSSAGASLRHRVERLRWRSVSRSTQR